MNGTEDAQLELERTDGTPPAWAAADDRLTAFRRLTDRHLGEAYRLAAVILGDPIDAEDVVHDAVLSAWRGFGSLRDPERFDAWLGRIVVNACRDRLRVTKRRRIVEVGRAPADGEHPTDPDAAVRAADRDVIRRAMTGLSPDEQVVVALRFHSDLTVPAIAERLGIPEGTVKSRLHGALGRLRAALVAGDR